MKAWVCREFREPFELKLEEIEKPEPGPGEIQIRVAAAGLNFGEMLVLENKYQETPPLPYIPQSEMAGVVTALGEGVTRFSVGDRVALCSFDLRGGALGEFAVVPEKYTLPLPERMSMAEGAAFPMNYWTAYNALVDRGTLRSGEWLVVHGATGGTGVAAIAIGKALGAKIIATGRGAERLAPLTALGADHVLDLAEGDMRGRIKHLTGGKGADVFFDPVGGEIFDESLRCIAPGGRILIVGFTSGKFGKVPANLLLVKMIAVIGVYAGYIANADPEAMTAYHRMVEMFADGRLKAQVGRTYAFEDLLSAYEDIVERRHFGKSVVLVSPELCGEQPGAGD